MGYPWGGADTLWTHAAEAATARGDTLLLSVSALLSDHPRIRALTGQGATLIIRQPAVPPRTLVARLRRKLGLLPSPDAVLIKALRTFRPELVIFSQGGTYDLQMHRQLTGWLRQQGIRYRLIANWQQENPYLDESDLRFIRETFVGADRIYFVSSRNLASTRRHLQLDLPNASVLQNPLRWQPTDVTAWPTSPTAQLATVSRLDESKGIQLLLESLHACGTTVPDWQLNIHGHGPYEKRLHELVAELDLGTRVRFCGYVPELRRIWSANHLLISPALEEGVPMTIPEAMLCHRPVLATCVGGAEDWLVHDQTGFLCPRPEKHSLVATLQAAFSSRHRWESMGHAAAVAAGARYAANDYLTLISPCSNNS